MDVGAEVSVDVDVSVAVSVELGVREDVSVGAVVLVRVGVYVGATVGAATMEGKGGCLGSGSPETQAEGPRGTGQGQTPLMLRIPVSFVAVRKDASLSPNGENANPVNHDTHYPYSLSLCSFDSAGEAPDLISFGTTRCRPSQTARAASRPPVQPAAGRPPKVRRDCRPPALRLPAPVNR